MPKSKNKISYSPSPSPPVDSRPTRGRKKLNIENYTDQLSVDLKKYANQYDDEESNISSLVRKEYMDEKELSKLTISEFNVYMNNLLLKRVIDEDEFNKLMKIRRRLLNKQYARKSRNIKTLKMEEISMKNARMKDIIIEKNEVIKSLQQQLSFYTKNNAEYFNDQFPDTILIDDMDTLSVLS